jgi:hypothetical protein
MDIIEEIKDHFSYQECSNIRFLLSDNPLLTENIIPKDHQQKKQYIWFDGEPDKLIWEGWNKQYYIENGSNVTEVECHLIASGKVGYTLDNKDHYIDTTLDLFIVVKKMENFSINNHNVYGFTRDQYIERQFSHIIKHECIIRGLMSPSENKNIDFGIFSTIWQTNHSKEPSFTWASSYYFWADLMFTLENIWSKIGEVEFYDKQRLSFKKIGLNRTPVIYLNPFDKRMLNICATCIQLLYSFWEKIAFLLNSIYNVYSEPELKRLTFKGYISKLENKVSSGHYKHLSKPNSNFDWFKKFNNKDHGELQTYRHPLVHYKYDQKIIKGDYFAAMSEYLLNNETNSDTADQIDKMIQEIKDVTLKHYFMTEEGLNNTIELIKES